MGETTAVSNSALQVSVSFGRFENESLSWERWSSFSPNKYLEEVEKCATPGSVAQKKAYFEAHYKKIAARKVELLAEQKQVNEESFGSEDRNHLDLGGSSCVTEAEFDISNTQDSIEGVKQETCSFGETSRIELNNLEEEVAVSRDCQSSSVEGENKELECESHSFLQNDKTEEVVCIKQVEDHNIEAEDVKEISHVVYKEKKSSQIESKEVKLDHLKAHKVTTIDRESIGAKTKTKSMLPTAKSSQISMPRSSKSASTPTKISASALSNKKGTSPYLSSRPFASDAESRKVSKKSLHMSMSSGRSNPDPVPHTTMRKSFIMEKMGDKDIVKRAFKTFQNNFNQTETSGEDRSFVKKQVPSGGTVSKVPTSTALRKENGRPTKVDSVDKRSGNSVRATIGPKSDIGAEKGEESSRKIKDKSNAKAVERTRLQLKLKEEKEADMKKLNHNFKATPLPAFYRGQKASKGHPLKGDTKAVNGR
ncbi:hypothetical protein TanjilG_25599 [Lupinus angustifolius]|uniref:TPX2 C-terminal domain-containing protein n=1 Tax=Lupinus angustifolius TaxID=3871 RepID=A0A4P1QTD3_LUPAN|nr:PREDICTED: protein WVD2-like 7 [Lupinus angustifolius]XP_019421807.1 PREDICTED: protein WVD2-like 7 [Lupinus angustifolius]OIV94537.1 hypothetical protein TanjilG_25599 [Lupinus angustifolius]